MGENGEENIGQIISKVFIGESLKKIDIMNWWIEKLIREMHLENVPYIYEYETLQTDE